VTSAATHTAAATRHQVLSTLAECCLVSPGMLLSLLGRWQSDLAWLKQSTTR
jgi:hypothetical protein